MSKTFRSRTFVLAAAFSLVAWCSALLPKASLDAQTIAKPDANGLMFGIHYGVPLKWSLALGLPLPIPVQSWTPFIAAEPGLGGWRASVGAAKMTTQLGTGMVARATALRTTGKPWRAPSQATYVGPELQFMPLFAIGARVGGLFRVGGKGGQRGLLTIDASVMF